MAREQLFVAGVAWVLGILALWAAGTNQDNFYRLNKIRWVQERWGRTAARWCFLVLGLLLVGLGVLIASGRSIPW